MQIAIFLFFQLGVMGLMVPYLPGHYKTLGFTGAQMGLLNSMGGLAMIFIPPIWGFMADKSGRIALLMRIACIGSVIVFGLMLLTNSYWLIAAIMAVLAIFMSPITSLADTVAVNEAKRLGTVYSRLRLWGSLGFIFTTFCFGYYLKLNGEKFDFLGSHFEIHSKAWDILPAVVVWMCIALATTFLLKDPPPTQRPPPPSFADAGRLLAQPDYLAFLLAAMTHWMSLSPYYSFFRIHLQDMNIGPEFVGTAFSFGVVTEVAVMWNFPILKARFPVFGMMVVASICTTIRWYLTSQVNDGWTIAAVQSFHGLSFGVFYVCCITHMERAVPAPLRATGRSLFSAISMGMGTILGAHLAGIIYDVGGAKLSFQVGSGLSLMTPILLWVSMRSTRRMARETQIRLAKESNITELPTQ